MLELFDTDLHVYEALMSIHVAKKESSSKTFRPRGSSSVTKLFSYVNAHQRLINLLDNVA